MSKRGKSIHLFLMDGTASGRMKCTLANWTGVAYKIPRMELDKCKKREDLKQSGVYFLFGISENTGKNVVYVGQAGARKNGEGILFRLQEHKRNPDKDYWTEAVVFTTSNNSFGPTEISYVENRFCTLATQAKRYVVKNGNHPTSGHITEEKESELEEFIDYAKIIMGALGHKIFEPLVKDAVMEKLAPEKEEQIDEQLLYLRRKCRKSGQVVKATCKQTNDGFVVLKGSQIKPNDSRTIPTAIKKRRQEANIGNNQILQDNELFKSPSYAAAFVLGMNTNGMTDWKNVDGKTLKEIENID